MLRRAVLVLAGFARLLADAPSAAETANLLHVLELDPDSCYRVNEIHFVKEDVRIYLTSGYLIFAKPVLGFRSAALFSAETMEGGDGEVLLFPPSRAERTSLAEFTHSPNLDEHFRTAAMIFTDGTAAELEKMVSAAAGGEGFTRKSPEQGAVLASRWSDVVRALGSSFEVRMVHDLLSEPGARHGLFFMAVSGNLLGNLDVVYDPAAAQYIIVGRTANRRNRSYFDTWTAFPPRSASDKQTPTPPEPFSLDNFRIQATIAPDLTMNVITRVTMTLKQSAPRILPFLISSDMRVTSATIDGQPAEVFQRDSLRDTLLRGNGNEEFLLIPAKPLAPGGSHEVEFQHAGAVISETADGVFYVGARGTWYPQLGAEFARFDLTFRYPSDLNLVTNGDIVEDRDEGKWRTTRRTTSSPIRFAGFNLGHYRQVSAATGPYHIEVCANRQAATSDDQARLRGGAPAEQIGDPDSLLRQFTNDVVSAFEFMNAEFGPPSIRTLTISPIPGMFGQGFPGLVYLSTLAYLDPKQRPPELRGRFQQTFFSDMLDTHEIAHQWWGNLVAPESYEDEWLMESLANYTALLYLEKRKGPKALETVLDDYRNHLLARGENGKTLESAGPITWGLRLESSLTPDGWRLITYEKGSWIIHMLRQRLGDEKFLALLRETCRRYRLKAMSTEQFRKLAAEFASPTAPDRNFVSFFENWVHETGIPAVKLSYTVRGLDLSGTLSGAPGNPDFVSAVPLEVQSGGERVLYWLDTSSETTSFKIHLRRKPTKVFLNPANGLFAVTR